MSATSNLGLTLPAGSDYADVAVLNDNWTKIDEAVAKKAELGADGKVPPEQLPDMDFDEAGSAAAVQKNLDAHTGNKNNPHAVTAAQVGADPAGSAAAVQKNLDAHTGNKNNPHGVTAAQVGADPAGSAEAVRSALASQVAALTTQMGGKAEIHTFSYVGTGTYGKNNKNSITADKPIVFAAILFRSGSDYDIALSEDQDRNFMLGNALTTSHREGYGFGQRYNSGVTGTYPAGSKSADGKTFYWSWPNDTTTDRSKFQYNESGVTYYGFYIC